MTGLRRLTDAGIERAFAFLDARGDDPIQNRVPPRELLYCEHYSQRIDNGVEVEHRPLHTRRDAGEYLASKLAAIRYPIADDAGMWSWLGMYYFAATAPMREAGGRKVSSECFVFSTDESTTEARRSYQRRYRHYLRGSWRLHEQHGEKAAFLLDEPISSFSDLADRILSNFRIFNSADVVPLMLRLYTDGSRVKPRYSRSLGGIRHLIRVLDQLERTHDVYGMVPDALLRILPPTFQEWDDTYSSPPSPGSGGGRLF